MGKHAKGTPPPGTPEKFNFKAFYSVVPFLLKGLLFRKAKSSPFFNNGECIVTPVVLSREERERIKTSAS